MLVKDGVAYLQAGGGIVFDSDPYDEWMETINKLGMCSRSKSLAAVRYLTLGKGANMQCITTAEEKHFGEQADGTNNSHDDVVGDAAHNEHARRQEGGRDATTHIDFAAG